MLSTVRLKSPHNVNFISLVLSIRCKVLRYKNFPCLGQLLMRSIPIKTPQKTVSLYSNFVSISFVVSCNEPINISRNIIIFVYLLSFNIVVHSKLLDWFKALYLMSVILIHVPEIEYNVIILKNYLLFSNYMLKYTYLMFISLTILVDTNFILIYLSLLEYWTNVKISNKLVSKYFKK